MTRIKTGLLIGVLAAILPPEALALISGGEGNKPLSDPGWPRGAAVIFNHPGRIAWWEGPPFGGGQWHSECRGDAKALSAVLADFAKLDVKAKRIILHDGRGRSFWLNPNQEAGKRDAAEIDWAFVVWNPENWTRLRKLPTDLNPTDPSDTSPPAQIDVFVGKLRWQDVTVPKGIDIVDRRLEAHGFTVADGIVIEGKVTDSSTKQPLAATVKLEMVEPQKTGGYLYPTVVQTKADATGRWVLKKVPVGWVRIVVEADGFAPRIAAYARFDGDPCWQSYDSALARSAAVTGRVADDAGKPLADAEVQLLDIAPESGGRYQSPLEYKVNTNAEGRFRVEQVPVGKASVWVRKAGYCRPGLGVAIATPKEGVELQMIRSASVRVTVDFTGKERPNGYIVSMEPEGGNAVGTYGGSGNIDAANRMSYKDVPPGRYVLHGQPNPGSEKQRTEPVTVNLKGGDVAEVTLKAK